MSSRSSGEGTSTPAAGRGARKALVPVLIGVILVIADIGAVVARARAADADPTTALLAVPAALLLVSGICAAVVMVIGRGRVTRTAALESMFPDAVIENVSDQVGTQLYRFRALTRDSSLVTRRYLSRTDVSVVVDADSIQGWVGSSHPRRAFLLPRSAIVSISLGQGQATPILTKPAMRVAVKFSGTEGDVYFIFGGGKKKNAWSLMSESQTQDVVRRVKEKLDLP